MADDPKNEEEKEERKVAAALKYDGDRDDAPRLVAKGFGLVAQRIIELAEKHNIPIRVDPDLTSVLARLKLNSEIPPELFKAVAEILALIYKANREAADPNAVLKRSGA